MSTHLHNLELVHQGQKAQLPSSDEVAADAAKAEDMLAQLQADTELAASVGGTSLSGMSDEEQALYDEELEREHAASTPAVASPNNGSGPTGAPCREQSIQRGSRGNHSPVSRSPRLDNWMGGSDILVCRGRWYSAARVAKDGR